MKQVILLALFMSVGIPAFTQNIIFNTDDGYIAEGYDVVSYFDDVVQEGDKAFMYEYEGAKLKFSSKSNLERFKTDPDKYFPQYGGWCAYAMGSDSSKVTINPKTYEIRDGKLYLFYNSWGTNTLKKWKKEGAEDLRKKADANWEKTKFEE